ncbi:uncharacterized protein NECHADRAFT_106577 [Fusarium vanettenii 77-13-4]|uniref:Uncharacterized protein n=1 Tax=Fusarium vanettenii (strain ATCC MYA-4622 / CBS 123669 / FGSC 9596 / NRRL 45880 / 77-13-4) TaxID=660122 RepID=C7ZNA7_FUSV7|nr:uncharacterized protein NECHADRAFT_106577 [Fusarium vanettenii 77-13-4]EEU34500.1 predicted protein [Fusarium vanettenii 77-13-4]
MVSLKALCSVLAFKALAVSAAPAAELPKAPSSTAPTSAGTASAEASAFPWTSANDRISSIKNQAKGSYKCTWYIGYNCNGKSYSNQEDANLADGDGAFNDSISSYSCRRK